MIKKSSFCFLQKEKNSLSVDHYMYDKLISVISPVPPVPPHGKDLRHATGAELLPLLDEQLVVVLVVVEAAQVLGDVVVRLSHVALIVA